MALSLQRCAVMRRLAGSCTGASLVEFALAAPVLLLTLAAIVELAMIVAVNALLVGGMHEASRPDLAAGPRQQERIVEHIAERSLGLIQVDDVTVAAEVYDSAAEVAALGAFVANAPGRPIGEPAMRRPAVDDGGSDEARRGEDGTVTVYTASLAWPLMTPLLDRVIGANGRVTLSARMAVQNDATFTASATDSDG